VSPPTTRNGRPPAGATAANYNLLITNTAVGATRTPHDCTHGSGRVGQLSPDALDAATPIPADQQQDDPDGVSVAQRFEAFNRRNPLFYRALVQLARQFKACTGRACGVQRLLEVARHDIELTTPRNPLSTRTSSPSAGTAPSSGR
jgi:hypothetical protein